MFDGTNTNLNFRIAMRAAELIERDGLCKGKPYEYGFDGSRVARCLIGAIADARREIAPNQNGDNLVSISADLAQERGGPHSASLYSDSPLTTAADVASLLRETARRCLVEGK